jgi:hypothetical protein
MVSFSIQMFSITASSNENVARTSAAAFWPDCLAPATKRAASDEYFLHPGRIGEFPEQSAADPVTRSRTMTSAPAWASQVAATRPESPAPTTTTSHVRSPAMAGPAGIGAATRADTDEALNGGTTPAAAADSVINRRRFRLLLPVGAGADRISASSRLPNSSAGAGGAWFPPRKLDLSIGPDARARRFDLLTGYSGRRHLATRKAQRRGKKHSL